MKIGEVLLLERKLRSHWRPQWGPRKVHGNPWVYRDRRKRACGAPDNFIGDPWISHLEGNLFQRAEVQDEIMEDNGTESLKRKRRNNWEQRALSGSLIAMLRSPRVMRGTGIERKMISWTLKFSLKGWWSWCSIPTSFYKSEFLKVRPGDCRQSPRSYESSIWEFKTISQ